MDVSRLYITIEFSCEIYYSICWDNCIFLALFSGWSNTLALFIYAQGWQNHPISNYKLQERIFLKNKLMFLLKFHKYLRDVASLMNSLSVLAHGFHFLIFLKNVYCNFSLWRYGKLFILKTKQTEKNIFHLSPSILHFEICLLLDNVLSFWLLELRRICLSFLKSWTLCIPQAPCNKMDLFKHLYSSQLFYVSLGCRNVLIIFQLPVRFYFQNTNVNQPQETDTVWDLRIELTDAKNWWLKCWVNAVSV